MSNNLITNTVQTDMSAAFDTVEHSILLSKLEHYGIRGPELEIIKSFLTDRSQFVEISVELPKSFHYV